MSDATSYVYAAMHMGNIVYVGKGKGERWKHCISGTSSSYHLNFLHFQGEELSVKILCGGLTEDTAFNLEQVLIYRLSPCANTQLTRLHYLTDESTKELEDKGISLDDLLKFRRNFVFADAVASEVDALKDWKKSDNNVFPHKEVFRTPWQAEKRKYRRRVYGTEGAKFNL